MNDTIDIVWVNLYCNACAATIPVAYDSELTTADMPREKMDEHVICQHAEISPECEADISQIEVVSTYVEEGVDLDDGETIITA